MNPPTVLAITKRTAEQCGTQLLLRGAGLELVTASSVTLAQDLIESVGVRGAIVCQSSWSDQEREAIASELSAQVPESTVIVRCSGCTGCVEESQTPGTLRDAESLAMLISAVPQGQKIFVVDDEKQIADLLGSVLQEQGFDVETFYAARSALLRANDCAPDVLVSDVVMPEMGGVALAEALQKQNPNTKVILISGNPYWKARGMSRGGELDGFTLLLKPFSLHRLLGLIRSEPS